MKKLDWCKFVIVTKYRSKPALQFLDLMSIIDKYSEISGAELVAKLK